MLSHNRTTPNQERIALLVAALRSGEFEQTTSYLKRYASFNGPEEEPTARHCCLGVACEVAIANGLDISERQIRNSSGGASFGFSSTTLPFEVMRWYGFADRDPALLLDPPKKWWKIWRRKPTLGKATGANDFLRWNFSQIADAFEWTYLKKNK